ncbi:hypothetical protein ETB97_010546 [Aspergillus alliaceus]|uniref:Uncharacterized protein n=1 Tax=Petromyces alliaceus TaxID=209559 RepID=A0A8H5ZSM2_PETAA|nr:hypothetical protein ETB97_010546 [Aspergillus burnettii]
MGVQKSIYLQDDMVKVAMELEVHPLVKHRVRDQKPPYEEFVGSHWCRFGGSGAWLPNLNVYLVVSRVLYTESASSWGPISFIRGQIYDEDWNILEGYTVYWNGDAITFPTTFDIPTVWWDGGILFGPEDPRIILESGVKCAEPIIIFNMIMDSQATRAMWIYRPFSNIATVLTIRDEERRPMEKNWAPFFDSYNSGPNPSEHIHFIYSFAPLRILKCEISTGYCDWVFKQEIPEQSTLTHEDIRGEMRGGTNFVPVATVTESVRVYAGFPRTNLRLCPSGSTYRPELVLLCSIGSYFYISYASDATVFGHAVLDQVAYSNPCGEGRIFIPNSIVRWDLSNKQDIMTVSVSVADQTVQILLLHGLAEIIHNLLSPDCQRYATSQDDSYHWSLVGAEVIACSVGAAGHSSLTGIGAGNGDNLEEN